MGLDHTTETCSSLTNSPSLQEMMLDVFQMPESPGAWASPMENSDSSPSYGYNHSQFQSMNQAPIKQQPRQTFHFVDQTPEIATGPSPKKRRRGETPVDLDKSRIAQQRRRDNRGQFIGNEVAARLEELESKLEFRETECDKLRQTISERDVQVELLKEQLHRLMAATPPQLNYAYVPLQTTARNYILVPSPNPGTQFAFQGKEAFKKKIDYSKIQLRKTESSLDDEKREVINSQEEWAYRQNQQQFIRKMQEQAQWQAFQQPPPERNSSPSAYGGAPSNIYPENLNKVGNLPVSAFTTKVNLYNKRQRLGKRERSAERLISDEQREDLMKMVKARIEAQEQMKYQKQVQEQIKYQHQMNWSHDMQSDQGQQKAPEVVNVDQWQFPPNYVPIGSDVYARNLGGPPSNIYPPPEKIGNLQVPAFTTKVNYSDVPLKKTETS